MPKLKQSFLTIVIGLALAAGLSYAWTGPTAAPPNNNAPAPINVSNLSQEKTGALQVNGFKNIGNSIFDGSAEFKSNVGIGTNNPQAKLDIAGKIKISDDIVSPVAGDIRWTGSDFEGYSGVEWLSFTKDENDETQISKSGQKVFLSSGHWTVPEGVTEVYVDMVGGGGGAGSSNVIPINARRQCTTSMGGGGGGGGGVLSKKITVSEGQKIAVNVGSPGANGVPGINPSNKSYLSHAGTNGGDSSFGKLVVRGGGGGKAGPPGVMNAHGAGGSSGGLGGRAGEAGQNIGCFNSHVGNGGGSFLGDGNGTGYGSGGGGGVMVGKAKFNASRGYVKVVW